MFCNFGRQLWSLAFLRLSAHSVTLLFSLKFLLLSTELLLLWSNLYEKQMLSCNSTHTLSQAIVSHPAWQVAKERRMSDPDWHQQSHHVQIRSIESMIMFCILPISPFPSRSRITTLFLQSSRLWTGLRPKTRHAVTLSDPTTHPHHATVETNLTVCHLSSVAT